MTELLETESLITELKMRLQVWLAKTEILIGHLHNLIQAS